MSNPLKIKRRLIFLGGMTMSFIVAFSVATNACTRIFWNDNGITMLSSRSADWNSPTQPLLVVLPRGMPRDGGSFAGKQMISENVARWTSRYGSVVTTSFSSAIFDGMNEKGLAAHGLWLYASDYGARDISRQGIRTTLWTQYILDNAATVDEAIRLHTMIQPVLVPLTTPDGSSVQIPVSLAIEDASGDSAIIQYIGGQLVVHHGTEYRVLANDPSYTDSLVDLSRYDFTNATRDIPLPGNTNSMDRFIRANFYIDFLRKTQPSSRQIAVSSLLSVARNVSAPIGAPYANPGSSTATDWRTVSDLTNRTYYFESTSRLSLLYTDLRTLNLSIGTPVRVINPLIPQSLHGNINRYYKPVKMPPFYGK